MEQQIPTLADKLIQHYGGRRKAADALSVSEETLRLWRLNGIPTGKAFQIERDSDGVVTAQEVFREATRREARA